MRTVTLPMARSLPVSKEVYELVSQARLKGESFSDVIRRFFSSQRISDIPKIFEEEDWNNVEVVFETQKELDAKRLKELL
jgi:predicted CopG family antitoxin